MTLTPGGVIAGAAGSSRLLLDFAMTCVLTTVPRESSALPMFFGAGFGLLAARAAIPALMRAPKSVGMPSSPGASLYRLRL